MPDKAYQALRPLVRIFPAFYRFRHKISDSKLEADRATFEVAVQLSSFAAVDPSVQVLDLAIKVRFVVLPCQPIHTGRSVSLECEETGPLD